MSFDAIDLIIDITDSSKAGLLNSFDSNDKKSLPFLIRNDGPKFRIRPVEPSVLKKRYWDDVDLTGKLITLAIGEFDKIPTGGTFQLSYNSSTTGLTTLAYNISDSALQTAVNANSAVALDGTWTITQISTGTYQLVANSVGTRQLFVGDGTNLTPASNCVVSHVQTGNATTKEIQILRLVQYPYAYRDSSWSAFPSAGATVTQLRAGGSSVNAIQRIVLNPMAYDGTFTITTAAGKTSPILNNASDQEVEDALNAVTAANWSVTGSPGQWDIEELSGTSISLLAVDTSGLIVPIGFEGVVDLNTFGMFGKFTSVSTDTITLKLEIQIKTPGEKPITVFQSAITISRDVIDEGRLIPTPMPSYYTAAESTLLFVNNRYSLTGLTGGGSTNLDGITTASTLIVGTEVNLTINNVVFVYQLKSGTSATNSPHIIRPTDYDGSTNQKYWKLLDMRLGQLFLYNPDQSKFHPIQIQGAAGSEQIVIGAGVT